MVVMASFVEIQCLPATPTMASSVADGVVASSLAALRVFDETSERRNFRPTRAVGSVLVLVLASVMNLTARNVFGYVLHRIVNGKLDS
jgi:hypothetical protein